MTQLLRRTLFLRAKVIRIIYLSSSFCRKGTSPSPYPPTFFMKQGLQDEEIVSFNAPSHSGIADIILSLQQITPEWKDIRGNCVRAELPSLRGLFLLSRPLRSYLFVEQKSGLPTPPLYYLIPTLGACDAGLDCLKSDFFPPYPCFSMLGQYLD